MAKKKVFSADAESRTSAFGLLRYANEYRAAAETVKDNNDDRWSIVPYMLVSHSIELGLKAFLRSRGATLADLLDAGHDLEGLHKEAMQRRLDRLWPEAYMAGQIVPILDRANERQALRYIVNGMTQLPEWVLARGVAYGLCRSLRMHCLRRSFGRAAAIEINATRGGKF
ncbi:hypothetical protein [Luteibacter yeojuensis]